MPSPLSTTHQRTPFGLRQLCFAEIRFCALWVLTMGLLLPNLALGQPTKEGTDADSSAAAMALMDEGNALYAKRDFEAAHQKFLEAWAIKQHVAIASNLVETEMKLGRYGEAAERLHYLLSSVPVDDQGERTALMTQLDECRHHLVALHVAVNLDGATVKVDGKVVGTSPIGSEVLVEPGRALVVAELEGYESGSFLLTAGAAGESRSINLYVTPRVERPAPTRSVSTAPKPPAPEPVPEQSGIRPRTLVVLSGAALTVAGTVLGVTYLKLRNDTEDRARGYRQQLADGACVPGRAVDVSLCSTLYNTWAKYDRQSNIMTGMFIGAGIAGAATLATYFLWPSRAARSERAGNHATVRAWTSKDGAGIQLAADF